MMMLLVGNQPCDASPPFVPPLDGFPPDEVALLIPYPSTDWRCNKLPYFPFIPIPAGECLDMAEVVLTIPGKGRMVARSAKVVCPLQGWRGVTYYENEGCTGRKKITLGEAAMGRTCVKVQGLGGGVPPINFRLRCLPKSIPTVCRPHFSLSYQQCASRIAFCNDLGLMLKWTGPGCVRPGSSRRRPQRFRDGKFFCKEVIKALASETD